MPKKTYNSYSPDLKMTVLKSHIIDKEPVSLLCEKHNIKPSVFYSWQKDLFERGAIIFQTPKQSRTENSKQLKQIQRLEEKLVQKNEVLAELMQEHLQLKKELGES